MIAIMVAEIVNWFKHNSRHTLLVFMTTVVVGGSLTLLRPEVCLELSLIAILWCGFAGMKPASEDVYLVQMMKSLRLESMQIVGGKALAALVIGIAHLFVILPAYILMMAVWGIAWGQLLAAFLVMLLGIVAAALLNIMNTIYDKGEKSFLSNRFILAWLGVTALPFLNHIQPFFLLWRVVEPGSSNYAFAGLAFLTSMIWVGGLVFLSAWLLQREVRRLS